VPEVEIPRDRYGKPLIIPPSGGKPVPYMRASSFAEVIDDRTQLEKWKLRMAVKGLAKQRELLFEAAVTPLTDKGKLNWIAEKAIEAAGGGEKASIGTSLHTLTELLDRGEPLPDVPQEWAADLAAYAATVTPRFRHAHIEEFMVCDELQIAGTPDRLSHEVGFDPLVVCDLKTGGNANYLGKHAAQLAIYAHSHFYDPATGSRTPVDVERGYGYVFHLPSGEGNCQVYRVDLEVGWEQVLLAADVRAFRKRKNLAVAA